MPVPLDSADANGETIKFKRGKDGNKHASVMTTGLVFSACITTHLRHFSPHLIPWADVWSIGLVQPRSSNIKQQIVTASKATKPYHIVEHRDSLVKEPPCGQDKFYQHLHFHVPPRATRCNLKVAVQSPLM